MHLCVCVCVGVCACAVLCVSVYVCMCQCLCNLIKIHHVLPQSSRVSFPPHQSSFPSPRIWSHRPNTKLHSALNSGGVVNNTGSTHFHRSLPATSEGSIQVSTNTGHTGTTSKASKVYMKLAIHTPVLCTVCWELLEVTFSVSLKKGVKYLLSTYKAVR